MDSCARCKGICTELRRGPFQFGCGGAWWVSKAGRSSCQPCAIDVLVRTQRWRPMQTQERRTETPSIGACSDCGTLVQRRIPYVDGMTHSTVELCERCWMASQQRQVFTGGCCGRARGKSFRRFGERVFVNRCTLSIVRLRTCRHIASPGSLYRPASRRALAAKSATYTRLRLTAM